jgi:hypothetical protein
MNQKLTFPSVATSKFMAAILLGQGPDMNRIRAIQPFMMAMLVPEEAVFFQDSLSIILSSHSPNIVIGFFLLCKE